MAMRSAPEARFPVGRAPGPGNPMSAKPSSARGALPALGAGETSSNGFEQLHPGAVFQTVANWAS